MSSYKSILKKYWNYDTFRPLQEEIINSVGSGNDTMAILPTGGGKSICFQVPALAQDGLCLVVSPLIALMQDQVEQLRARNIRTEMIVSGMSARKVDYAYNNCTVGDYKFLYVSPERLKNEDFLRRFQEMPISMIAIDEAHCISQWGYDFRPSYLEIKQLREIHHVPMIALTATATPEVQEDIQKQLELKNANRFVGSLKRNNLSFHVRKVPDKIPKLIEILSKIGGQGIVYTMSRRKTKMIADQLNSQGISATFYHAGLSKDVRSKRQEQWINNEVRIMVATNAFGMGIDKSDVRMVVHFEVPENLEAYYQEAGRAGRDGKNALAILLSNQKDMERLEESKVKQYPEQTILKSVLVGLWNYLQISFGDGHRKPYPFSIIPFAKRYDLDAKMVLNALRTLTREGFISLSDPFYSPSTFYFLMKNEDLYRYQVKHANYEPIIKVILRNYAGVFDQPVTIKEKEIARELSETEYNVRKKLQFLHQSRIANYYGQSEFPLLSFTDPRPMNDVVSFNHQQIEFLRSRHIERINSMLEYLRQHNCRMQYMQHYFGENDVPKCGICDFCIGEKTNKAVPHQLAQDILSLLKDNSLQLDEIITKTGSLRNQVVRVLEFLKKEERIEQNQDGWRLRKSSAR